MRQKALRPGQIYACAKNWDKLCKNTEEKGMHACRDAQELAASADIVIIAVKPYLVAEVVSPIKELLREKIVVSVAVGYTFDKYEEVLAAGTHHLSVLPNTPVSIGEGVIVCEQKHSLADAEFALVEGLFSKIAMVQVVEARLLGIAGTICGCGPAFVSMFMEALGDAGVMHGLPRAMAYQLAGQMVAGTGKLLTATGAHPGMMKDAVCSPAGTTIIGVTTLERKGLRSAVIDAVDAIERR